LRFDDRAAAAVAPLIEHARTDRQDREDRIVMMVLLATTGSQRQPPHPSVAAGPPWRPTEA